MKLLKNRGFAVIVLIAAIALSSLYGLSKKPAVEIPEGGAALNENLSTGYLRDYVVDEAPRRRPSCFTTPTGTNSSTASWRW